MITIVTHDGDFHPDDVFAVATLKLVYGDCEVLRSRKQGTIEVGDVVVDIGGKYDPSQGLFDHHQVGGAGVRTNGIPYASFGLVWKHFGKKLCNGNEEVAQMIDARLVAPLDANDVGMSISEPIMEGIGEYTFGSVAWAFRPTWKEKGVNNDAMFLEAVDLAKILLTREIRIHLDRADGYIFVERAYKEAENKEIIVLEDAYPWEEVLARYPEPLYCIYPKGEVWRVKAVREDTKSFKNRKDFPASWRGRRDEELQALTGVSDAVFAHLAGFMAVAKSEEGALALAKKSIASQAR